MKYFKAIRAISLTATLTPGILVLLDGILIRHWQFQLTETILTFLSILFLHISVNVLNDFEDHERGIDTVDSIGGSGMIQKKLLTPKETRNIGISSLALSILLGLKPLISMAEHSPQSTTLIFLFALVGSWGYSCKPFSFKYNSLGDLVVFILCGPLLSFGFSLALFGQFHEVTFFIGSLMGLAAVGILHANNINDLESDLKKNAHTVANSIGFKLSKLYFAMLYVFIFQITFYSWSNKIIQLPVLIVTVIFCIAIIPLVKTVIFSKETQNEKMNLIRFQSAGSHLMLGVLLGIGIVLSTF